MRYDMDDQYSLDVKVTFNQFLAKVFLWMFTGLMLTGLTAYVVSNSYTILSLIFGSPFIFYGFIILEFVLVVYFSRRALEMSSGRAIGVFLLYSVVNGITLSSIFLAYTSASIAYVFLVASVIFGVMAIYGYVTKTDLSAFRTFLFIGLIGVVLLSVVNIFVASSQLSLAIGYIGVVVFAGLTAYDIQKMKSYYLLSVQGKVSGNIAIIGALSLYLDFINLFLMLLRIFGRRR